MVASSGVIYGLSSFGRVLVCQLFCPTPERGIHDYEEPEMCVLFCCYVCIVQMSNIVHLKVYVMLLCVKLSKFLNC